ncbi:MAG: hypothetical protein ABSA86_09840 [Oryzomonas sp.]
MKRVQLGSTGIFPLIYGTLLLGPLQADFASIDGAGSTATP